MRAFTLRANNDDDTHMLKHHVRSTTEKRKTDGDGVEDTTNNGHGDDLVDENGNEFCLNNNANDQIRGDRNSSNIIANNQSFPSPSPSPPPTYMTGAQQQQQQQRRRQVGFELITVKEKTTK